MKISIIIPNFNGEHFLKKCLISLYNQSMSDFELIIVDNASSDNSKKVVDASNLNICWIQLNKNYGFSYAVNRGIDNAKGDYIVLLNNDVEVEEKWLSQLVDAIDKSDKIFSVSSKMLKMDRPDKIDDAGDYYTILGFTLKRGDNRKKENYLCKSSVFSSCAGAAIYRRSVLDEIGYFDENFFAYMEDVDIGYRAKIQGYKNVYCPDAIVYHVGSGTSGSKYNAFKVKLSARNNINVYYKNMPMLQMLINLPFFVIGCIIKYIFFSKKGYGSEYLEGIKEGLTTLNTIKKVKFEWKNLINYCKIEFELIINTFRYFIDKIV